MRKRNFGLLAAGATLLFGTLALAGGWGRGAGPGAYEALGLSQEQTRQIEALRERCQKSAEGVRQELFAKKQELRALWNGAELKPEEIQAKQAELRELQDEVQARQLQCETERRAVLTADQKAKLAELRSERGGGPRAGWGGSGGWAQGGNCDGRGRGGRGRCAEGSGGCGIGPF
jgi:Spy/CpxP family protein refolding chaperone